MVLPKFSLCSSCPRCDGTSFFVSLCTCGSCGVDSSCSISNSQSNSDIFCFYPARAGNSILPYLMSCYYAMQGCGLGSSGTSYNLRSFTFQFMFGFQFTQKFKIAGCCGWKRASAVETLQCKKIQKTGTRRDRVVGECDQTQNWAQDFCGMQRRAWRGQGAAHTRPEVSFFSSFSYSSTTHNEGRFYYFSHWIG